MILLLIIYVFIALALISGAIFLKGKVQKTSLFLTIGLVIVPLCFIVFLGLFKLQIQRGKFLSGLGPILILVAPPEDLDIPLGFENLDPNKKEYHFEFAHKYVGNHVVDLSFNKLQPLQPMKIADNNFEVEYVVSKGDKIIFTQKSRKYGAYWGLENSGLTFISYKVPLELPINTKLTATIKINGDIAAFINKYGATRINIRKGSDL